VIPEIVKNYRAEIVKYCADNNLSANALFSSGCSEGKNDLFITGRSGLGRGKLGLMDTVPMPVTLKIFLEDGKLRFEQTEHTYVLYEHEHAKETVFV